MGRNAKQKGKRAELRAADGLAGPDAPHVRHEGAARFLRNRLISKLLQDRGVLRLISAPFGYGKTELVREYVRRMLEGKKVAWVDAASPAFLGELDRGRMQGFDEFAAEHPALIVLDDVPWLHEGRATILSRRIDAALYRGIEVIATTLPSCDCLRSRQADCVLVSALDLEITEQECCSPCFEAVPQARARGARLWHRAKEGFMGKVPAVAWGDSEGACGKVLDCFFREKLPSGVFRSALAILVMGTGTIEDLERVGCGLADEDVRMLAQDYPFLCIDAPHRTFAVPNCPLPLLRESLIASGAMGIMGKDTRRLVRSLLAHLLNSGALSRMEELLGTFCSNTQCANWLLECGWELVDRGEVELVDGLLTRCPEGIFAESEMLQVLRAWSAGLLGDRPESVFCAQNVLSAADDGEGRDDEGHQGLRALAYLALVAFGEGGAAIFSKDEFSGDCDPVSAEGLLARVVDLCSENDLRRAFADCGMWDPRELEQQRSEADDGHASALSALFSQSDDRLRDEPLYRLAFHLVCFVDSELLKPLVRTVGCEVVVRARQNGKGSFTEALIVRDLWKTGFFGVCGPAAGRRDAHLFETASRMLQKLSALQGFEETDVPWEVDTRPFAGPGRGSRSQTLVDDVEIMNVRLFGSFEVMVGDRYIKEGQWRKKSRLLFILVVLNQGKDVSRDWLFDQLWPEMARVRALDNFYSAWSAICALLDDGPYLERNGAFCRMNNRYVVTDVGEFEQLARRLLTEHPDTNTLLDIYARIESLYRGGLVPSETESPIINAQRERFEAMYIDAMVTATECSLKANDARLALWFARKAAEAGKKREDVYQALIRAQIAAGQRCSAVKTYFECRQYLRDELGLDPSYEMQELYNKLISIDPTLLSLDMRSFRRG